MIRRQSLQLNIMLCSKFLTLFMQKVVMDEYLDEDLDDLEDSEPMKNWKCFNHRGEIAEKI